MLSARGCADAEQLFGHVDALLKVGHGVDEMVDLREHAGWRRRGQNERGESKSGGPHAGQS
jgi:hypothetical protein